MVGNNYKHRRWLALGGDYDYITNHNVNYEASAELKKLRSDISSHSNEIEHQEIYTQNDFNKVINRICQFKNEFFITKFW